MTRRAFVERLESWHGLRPCLDPAMILLNDVISSTDNSELVRSAPHQRNAEQTLE